MLMLDSTCTTVSNNVIMTKNAMQNEFAVLFNTILGNILRNFSFASFNILFH